MVPAKLKKRLRCVEVNGDAVVKALEALGRADILAFTWTWPFQSDVSIAFTQWSRDNSENDVNGAYGA
jgi:hypothetical protein